MSMIGMSILHKETALSTETPIVEPWTAVKVDPDPANPGHGYLTSDTLGEHIDGLTESHRGADVPSQGFSIVTSANAVMARIGDSSTSFNPGAFLMAAGDGTLVLHVASAGNFVVAKALTAYAGGDGAVAMVKLFDTGFPL